MTAIRAGQAAISTVLSAQPDFEVTFSKRIGCNLVSIDQRIESPCEEQINLVLGPR
jgi:hypothetical protein